MLVKSHVLFSLILEHATQKYCLKNFFTGLSAVVLKIFLLILKLGSNKPATILKSIVCLVLEIWYTYTKNW